MRGFASQSISSIAVASMCKNASSENAMALRSVAQAEICSVLAIVSLYEVMVAEWVVVCDAVDVCGQKGKIQSPDLKCGVDG